MTFDFGINFVKKLNKDLVGKKGYKLARLWAQYSREASQHVIDNAWNTGAQNIRMMIDAGEDVDFNKAQQGSKTDSVEHKQLHKSRMAAQEVLTYLVRDKKLPAFPDMINSRSVELANSPNPFFRIVLTICDGNVKLLDSAFFSDALTIIHGIFVNLADRYKVELDAILGFALIDKCGISADVNVRNEFMDMFGKNADFVTVPSKNNDQCSGYLGYLEQAYNDLSEYT